MVLFWPSSFSLASEWPEANESLEVFASSSRFTDSDGPSLNSFPMSSITSAKSPSQSKPPSPEVPKSPSAVSRKPPSADGNFFDIIAGPLKQNLEESFASIKNELLNSSKAPVVTTTTQYSQLDDTSELLRSFKAAIKALMRDHYGSDAVVGDSSEPGLQLIDALERILAHGLRDELNGSKVTYWNFLNQFSRLGDDGVDGKFLCNEVDTRMSEESSNAERGRCFLRLALNKRSISLLGTLLERTDIVSNWYRPSAFVMNPDLAAQVSHLLVSIESIPFDFSLNYVQTVVPQENPDAELGVVSRKKGLSKKTIGKKKKKRATVAIEGAPLSTVEESASPPSGSSPTASPPPELATEPILAIGSSTSSSAATSPRGNSPSEYDQPTLNPLSSSPPSTSLLPSPTLPSTNEPELNSKPSTPPKTEEPIFSHSAMEEVKLDLFNIEELLADPMVEETKDPIAVTTPTTPTSPISIDPSLTQLNLTAPSDPPIIVSTSDLTTAPSAPLSLPSSSPPSSAPQPPSPSPRNPATGVAAPFPNLGILADLDSALKAMEDIESKFDFLTAPSPPQASNTTLTPSEPALASPVMPNPSEPSVTELSTSPVKDSPAVDYQSAMTNFQVVFEEEQKKRAEDAKRKREEELKALRAKVEEAEAKLPPSLPSSPVKVKSSLPVESPSISSQNPNSSNPFVDKPSSEGHKRPLPSDRSKSLPASFDSSSFSLSSPSHNEDSPTITTSNLSPGLNPKGAGAIDALVAPTSVTLEDFLKGEFKPSSSTVKPLPKAQRVPSHDIDEDDLKQVMMTKKQSWTAPKKQIFFKEHSQGTVEDQFNMCAGCATPISVGWFTGPRYCRYSGKYYCHKCHTNEKEIIPARVLWQWDFTPLPVSNFYKKFLVEAQKERLFDISAINPTLYKIVPKLKVLRLLRVQLKFLRGYIASCRDSPKLLAKSKSNQFLYESNNLSIADLVQLESGGIVPFASELVNDWRNHCRVCPVCSSKGFVCEVCHNPNPIFPFDLKIATQCPTCLGVFHRTCYKKETCVKCARMKVRQGEAPGKR